VIQNAKQIYYSNLLLSLENKTEVTWNIINIESGKVQNMNHTPSLFKLNNTNIHTDQAAEAFNRYFVNLVDCLKVNNVNIDTAISLLRNLYPVIFQRCYPSY
jgi:vacuolar-type H+-ATPase subunit D/Vma8